MLWENLGGTDMRCAVLMAQSVDTCTEYGRCMKLHLSGDKNLTSAEKFRKGFTTIEVQVMLIRSGNSKIKKLLKNED